MKEKRREEKRREEKRREEKRREEKRRQYYAFNLTNRLLFKLLIALLSFILLFSISCESNEESSNHPYKPPAPKHELEGTWVGYDKTDTKYEDYKLEFKVDSDGNITFSPRPFPIYGTGRVMQYTYNGKIETNSIVYSYTNDVSCALLTEMGDGYGKFIFSSPSNCTAKYDRIDYYKPKASLGLAGVTVEFTKQ